MWGDPGVSKKLRLSNGSTAWGTGGLPVSTNIQPTGILRHMRLITSGTPTYTVGTGTINKDVQGYGNQYTLVTVSPNQQSPILSLSGYGAQLVQYMLATEDEFRAVVEANMAGVLNPETAADQFAYATSGSAYRNALMLPIAQRIRSLGGDIGMWPLQNPAVTLQAAVTPSSASTATPYNIYSTTAGASPYLVTGNATVTLASPTFDIVRELWQVPASETDYPPFNLVSSWIEESPQGANPSGASSVVWQMTPLSGILARLGVYVYDSGNSNNGVAASNLTASNALVLSYDANTPKFSESSYEALARQHQALGFDAPQGFYFYDLLGKDLTLADSLNSHVIGNIKFTATFNNALGGSSAVKIIKQVISPLVIK